MTTTDDILGQIEKGGTLDELAKVLGMSKSLLVARISSWFVLVTLAKCVRVTGVVAVPTVNPAVCPCLVEGILG